MKDRWVWMLAALPSGTGLLVTFLVLGDQMENHTFFIEGGLVFVAPLIGGILSGGISLILLVFGHAQSKAQQTVSTERTEMSAERRRFLQRLDHELKNPLTAIRAGLTNLSWLPTEKERQDALASVEGQTLRLSRLAADLRKLADLETRSLERTPVQIADLLQEVIETARERPEAGQIHLNLSVPQAPWPLPVIQGDPDLLFLAVHNLVDNALKFTAAGDTVEIRASEDEETILVEVADTGPGIPAANLPRIFDPFFTTKPVGKGTGLGLSICYGIIKKLGGEIVVHSQLDVGTTFKINLPLHEHKGDTAEPGTIYSETLMT